MSIHNRKLLENNYIFLKNTNNNVVFSYQIRIKLDLDDVYQKNEIHAKTKQEYIFSNNLK